MHALQETHLQLTYGYVAVDLWIYCSLLVNIGSYELRRQDGNDALLETASVDEFGVKAVDGGGRGGEGRGGGPGDAVVPLHPITRPGVY